MRFHRSRPVLDGLMVASLTLASFGLFCLAYEQSRMPVAPPPGQADSDEPTDARLPPPPSRLLPPPGPGTDEPLTDGAMK
ncbi:MAG: hypothetical protein RL272_818 [Candidatus Parcubacteria bacterium]|jgi:hypothetical protein